MLALYAGTFLMAFVSGVVPYVLNIEVYLLGVAALSRAPAVPVVALAVAGQVLAECVLYLAGKGVLTLRFIRWKGLEKAQRTFEKHRGHSLVIVFCSALVGLPPFYPVSLLAGAMRLPLASFVVLAVIGRSIRLSVVYLAPQWLHLSR